MTDRSVIGLEGIVPTTAVVAWGAAAIRNGEALQNSLSGAKISVAKLHQLDVTLFEARVALNEVTEDAPLIAVMVNRASILQRYFKADPGREGVVLGHGYSKNWWYYVFQNRSLFDVYAHTVADRVLKYLFKQTHLAAESTGDMLRWALVLTPSHPVLNALRVHVANKPEIMEKFARASLRSVEAKEDFQHILDALRGGTSTWVLKYEGGIAEGGGLDVPDTAKTFNEVDVAQQHVIPYVRTKFPFLQKPRGARVAFFEAASATITFKPIVKDQTIGDMVARYLTMYWVQEMLRGNKPPIAETKSLHEALDHLSAPDDNTTATQVRLEEDVPEKLAPIARLEATRVEDMRVLRVLGIVNGLSRGTKLEIALSPGNVAIVSTADNGQGDLPLGVDVIDARADFLRMPALATLIRKTSGGSEHFDLQKLTLLRPGAEGEVDSFPSTVVTRAYVHATEPLPVRAGPEVIDVLGFGQVAYPQRSRESEQAWLSALKPLIEQFEMSRRPLPSGWIPPAGGFRPRAVERLLIALFESGGRTPLKDLVAYVQTQFSGAVVRMNNTRREVKANAALLQFDPRDASIVIWTEQGQRIAEILRAINARGAVNV
jgi:hypothetical protein